MDTQTEEGRRELIKQLQASNELSNMKTSDVYGQDTELYIRGEITADELMWRTLQRKRLDKANA